MPIPRVAFVDIEGLGYDGAGVAVRGFDLSALLAQMQELDANALGRGSIKTGSHWRAFAVQASKIAADPSMRLDLKYWNPQVVNAIAKLQARGGAQTIKTLNTIPTARGRSPSASDYVSEEDGFALVVKSGSNISKYGLLVSRGDFVERNLYAEYENREQVLHDGDIVLASTGDGTLGKCCVYRRKGEDGSDLPAVPEGHVTVVRVDSRIVWPEYLCDYLRKGFGWDQLYRLYTGSTGMVEATPDDVDRIVVPPLPTVKEQKRISRELRNAEQRSLRDKVEAETRLSQGEATFRDEVMGLTGQ